MVKGNQIREAYLMRKYEEEEIYLPYNDKEIIDAEVDEQYSFTEEGSIVQYAK